MTRNTKQADEITTFGYSPTDTVITTGYITKAGENRTDTITGNKQKGVKITYGQTITAAEESLIRIKIINSPIKTKAEEGK